MKRTIATFLLTAAAGTSLVFAQGPRTPPTPQQIAQRRVDGLTRLLTLSATQQPEALTIFTTSATTDAGLQTSLKTARDSLRTAILAGDANTIAASSNTIGALTGQITASDATADAAFYKILDAGQQAKFSQFLGRGPGGFGGGPGPRSFRGRPQ